MCIITFVMCITHYKSYSCTKVNIASSRSRNAESVMCKQREKTNLHYSNITDLSNNFFIELISVILVPVP